LFFFWQLQRIAIVLCLGTPADVYLLDEPSAFLDCEQRALVTKVMRSWIITHLGKAGFIIEHDILMASALYVLVFFFFYLNSQFSRCFTKRV